MVGLFAPRCTSYISDNYQYYEKLGHKIRIYSISIFNIENILVIL
ncbi:hypothetical protein NIES267_22300 [Calothrix parasitica NIES-267]|uniref:Uncharacterized protein n=1 Tax=Calothrix parasitica NIES-267 TaxID=1973488 RepID=A0A1Z4LNE3_9CYAN|nr:hypothetical protein NIES267_22300 [Calothrix parasitica NIES-267]